MGQCGIHGDQDIYEQPGSYGWKCRICARNRKKFGNRHGLAGTASDDPRRQEARDRQHEADLEDPLYDPGNSAEATLSWFNIGAKEIERAMLQYQSGEAERLRSKYGLYTREECASLVSRNVGTVNRWFRGELPQQRYRKLATALLLTIEEDTAEQDLVLKGHRYPATKAGSRQHTADLDNDTRRCNGVLGKCGTCTAQQRGDYLSEASTSIRLTTDEVRQRAELWEHIGPELEEAAV